MDKELIERIRIWNEIKYPNDNETRIIVAKLEPKETVTTALNNI